MSASAGGGLLAALARASLARRPIVVLALLALVAAGAQAWRTLPIDAFPDVSVPQVKVVIKAPGMTPEEVEARITVPLEQELIGIPGQRMLRSVAKYALTDVTLDFDDATDLYWARNQVAERLSRVLPDLPPGVSGGLAPATTPLGEVFMFTVENPRLSLAERRSLLDWSIRPRLRTIAGVADVNVLGGEVRSFEVIPRPAALNARGVTLTELAEALRANTRNDGAGRVRDGDETLQVRVEAGFGSLAELRAIGVAVRDGVPVRVGDLADVRVGSLTRYGAVTRDGTGEAVQGLVLALRGANAQALVGAVRAQLAEIEATLPEGTRLVPFYDRGALVERATGTVGRALAEAIVLVVLLLVAFLGNLRAAFVVALTLPLAALATFVLMRATGLSANLMSLGGLAIAIGMLVDGAVVVVEHAVARLGAHEGASTDEGAGPGGEAGAAVRLRRLGDAVAEVARPVATGVGIIALVFVPLLTLEGLEGKLFSPVALTIVYALGASLLLALTAVPVLASLAFGRRLRTNDWLMRRLRPAYARLLAPCFAHPRTVAAAAALLLAAALAALPWLGRSFVPTLDEGDLIVQLEKLPSVSLDASIGLDARIERALRERVPEIRGAIARTGSDDLGLDPMGLNQTDMFLVLAPREQWADPDKEALIDRIRAVLADFPGVATTFTQPIEMRTAEMLTGVRGDLAVKIFGPELATLNRLSEQVAATLRGVAGAQDVFALRNEGVQTLRLSVDRLGAARAGVSAERLQQLLRMEVEGEPLAIVPEPGRRTPLLLRGPGELRDSAEALRTLQLATDVGAVVPLSALVRFSHADGPVKVDREFGQRYVTVQANVRDRDLVGFVADAQRAVADRVALPAGYRLEWGGEFRNQQRAAARLSLVVPAVLALVVFVLWLSFGSMREALLIVALVPFASAGGVFSLLAAGEYLSVPASVGFIALLGIAVLNGVVMVETFERRQASGATPGEAARDGALERLRPVLMTASITAFGLVPLLAATGPGSEVQRPLAAVVVGGLVTATLVTLLVLPVAWRWLAERAGRAAPPRGAGTPGGPGGARDSHGPGGPARAGASIRCSGPAGPDASSGPAGPRRGRRATGRVTRFWRAACFALVAASACLATAPAIAQQTDAIRAAPSSRPLLAQIDLPLLPPSALARDAVEDHPDVAAARALLAADAATRERLRAGEHEFQAEAGTVRRSFRSGASADDDWTMTLSRPLRLPAKRTLDFALGDRQVARGRIALLDARHETSRQLLASWFGALRTAAAAEQLREQAALIERTLDVVRRRLRAGDAAELERLQAEAALRLAEGQLLAARQRAATARTALDRSFPAMATLALPVEAVIGADARAAQPVAPVGDADAWREQILAANHEIALRRAEAALRTTQAERTRAERLPDPTVGVHGYTDRAGQERVVGLFLAIPLPGQARSAAARAAGALAVESEARAAGAERRVVAEALAAWRAAVDGTGAWASLLQARRDADQAARLAARAFELGEGTLADVLLARRVALDAATGETAARLDAIEAHARLRLDAHLLWDFDD